MRVTLLTPPVFSLFMQIAIAILPLLPCIIILYQSHRRKGLWDFLCAFETYDEAEKYRDDLIKKIDMEEDLSNHNQFVKISKNLKYSCVTDVMQVFLFDKNSRGNIMPFVDNITQVARNNAVSNGSYTTKNISKSSFDKTYIGHVVDKETYKDMRNGLTLIKRWLIAANGTAYYVNVENADIKSVGQTVRLYVPNNDKSKAFAEVINPATAPDKIVYTENDPNYDDYKEYGVNKNKNITKDDVTIDTIVTTWNLADKTELKRSYIITIINKDKSDEEATSIVCPDGKQIDLKGFLLRAD